MASAKKTSSNSKSSSQSSKKSKIGSPMKKKSSSSQNKNSPNKKQSQSKSNTTSNTKTRRTAGPSSKRPNYQRMITEALTSLDSRKGSSRSKIFNHMKSTYGIENGKVTNNHFRAAMEALLEESIIALASGTGYSNGYYRMTRKGKKSNTRRSSSSSPKKKSTTTIISIITKSN
jgi:hypothetical protein